MESAIREQTLNEAAVTSLTEADALADPIGTIRKLADMNTYITQVLSMLGQATILPELAGLSQREVLYFLTYVQASARTPNSSILLRALFVAAVGTVEPLVTRLVQLLLHDSNTGKYTSLADPKLDEAARKLCCGPPSKWRTALMKLGLGAHLGAIAWANSGSSEM